MKKTVAITMLFADLSFGTPAIAQTVKDIGVGEKGFVLRGDSIVREVGPGLNWKIPFLGRWAVVDALREREKQFEVVAPLEDGQTCAVSMRVIYRIEDARRALEWRLANDPSVPERGAISPNYYVYSEPERVARERLTEFMASRSIDAARQGAIEKDFMRQAAFSYPLDDGTRILRARPVSASCSEWVRPDSAKYCPPSLGQKRSFSQDEEWRIDAEGIETFATVPKELIAIMTSGKRARIMPPVVTFGIVQPPTFADGADDSDRIIRLATMQVALATGKKVGSMDVDALPTLYNGFVESDIPDRMNDWMAEYGLKIVSVDFSGASYRMVIPNTDCVKGG